MAQAKTKKKSLTYLQAVQQLKKDNLAPVYVIFGEEKFLHDELICKIIDISIEPSTRDFNFDLFYASDVDVEKVVDIASSYPMMADRRLVIVKDIHKYKAPALKHLAEYVAKPSKSTCLVVTVPEKIKSGKWINSMVSSAVAVDCRQLYENEVVTWIKNYVQVKKMEIEIQAVHSLQEQVGTSLLNLVNELEKVQVNIHPRTKISVADIQKITSISKQSTVFELCDAVGNKNFPKSISILNNLLDRGEKPTGVIVQLTRHLANLLKIRESIRLRKSSAKELAAVTKVNPYFINKIKLQANNFKSEQLRQAFDYLATADLHLKTGYQQPKLVMELLLYNLIKR